MRCGRTRRAEGWAARAARNFDDSRLRLVGALERKLRHMSRFDRLPPEDQGWVKRMFVRVLAAYACLMMLLLAGAGLRIGVVEPFAQGLDFPKVGETDGRWVAASIEPRAPCARPACASDAVDDAPAAPGYVHGWAV